MPPQLPQTRLPTSRRPRAPSSGRGAGPRRRGRAGAWACSRSPARALPGHRAGSGLVSERLAGRAAGGPPGCSRCWGSSVPWPVRCLPPRALPSVLCGGGSRSCGLTALGGGGGGGGRVCRRSLRGRRGGGARWGHGGGGGRPRSRSVPAEAAGKRRPGSAPCA